MVQVNAGNAGGVTIGVEHVLPATATPPASAWAEYLVNPDPPLDSGASQLTTTELSPRTPVTVRGASGFVLHVTAELGAEAEDCNPSALVAFTVNV